MEKQTKRSNVEILIKGSRFRGTNGIAWGPDNLIWMGSVWTGGIYATIEPGNNGIAFSQSGRLFISQWFMGSKLYEIYPDRDKKPRFVADLGKQMSNAMNFGPDGKLYGSPWVTNEVTRIDTETGAIEVIASNVGIPSAVKFNSKGELHVLNIKVGEVSKVDIETGKLELVA